MANKNGSIPRERVPRFLQISLEAVELGVEVVEPGRDVARLLVDLAGVVAPTVQVGHPLTQLVKESNSA